MNLRILLADDHQMFREALRILLERNSDFEIVGETGNGNEVLSLTGKTSPKIVCLDIDMPGLNGVEITRQITAAYPLVKVIALSVDPVDSHLKWIDDINETQNTRVNFPIIADADRKVSGLYDLIHPNANDTLTVRSLLFLPENQ